MRIPGPVFHSLRLFAIVAWAVWPGCSSDTHSNAVKADVSFSCLWWSEAQMEGLNPNAPPPKRTEVKLTKWEYSDPVGVPHPDVVDVVVALKSGGQDMSKLRVEITRQWKEGSLSAAATAVWQLPLVIKKLEGVGVVGSSAYTIRVPVDLKSLMDELQKKGKWPYGLRIKVKAFSSAAQNSVVAEAAGELPIHRGD